MEFPHKYGVIGAGAVGKSLIGRLPPKGIALGPVSAVSYRVASRIANALKSGFPVRDAEELRDASAILFHAPPNQLTTLLEILEHANIAWLGHVLIFCDCDIPVARMHHLRQAGASIAVARQFGLPSRVVLEGAGRALILAHRLAREAGVKATEIHFGSADAFDAAVTLSTSALTPLIDKAAELLRSAGVRETEAPRIAAALFGQTAAAYAHSGKQSWAWYIRYLEVDRILAQAGAAQSAAPVTGEIFRLLLLFGLDVFAKHPELAAALRQRLAGSATPRPGS